MISRKKKSDSILCIWVSLYVPAIVIISLKFSWVLQRGKRPFHSEIFAHIFLVVARRSGRSKAATYHY